MNADACLHCGLMIWLDDYGDDPLGVWTHTDTGQRACPPLTTATPSTVRLG